MTILGCFLPGSSPSFKRIPLRIGAFVQPDLADPTYTGRVVVTAMGAEFYTVTGLYNAAGQLLPGNITENFISGGWQGFVDFLYIKGASKAPDGKWYIAVGCQAMDVNEPGISGAGTACQVPAPVPVTVRHHWSVYQGNRKLAFGSYLEQPNMRFYIDGTMAYPSFTGGPQSKGKKK